MSELAPKIESVNEDQVIKKIKQASNETYPSEDELKGEHDSLYGAIEDRSKEIFEDDADSFAAAIYEIRMIRDMADFMDRNGGQTYPREESSSFSEMKRVHQALLKMQGNEETIANFRVLALETLGVDLASSIEKSYPSVFGEAKNKDKEDAETNFGDSKNFDIDSVKQLLAEAGIEEDKIINDLTELIGAIDEAIRKDDKQSLARLSEEYGVMTSLYFYKEEHRDQLSNVDDMLAAVVGDAAASDVITKMERAVEKEDSLEDAEKSLDQLLSLGIKNLTKFNKAYEAALRDGDTELAEILKSDIVRMKNALDSLKIREVADNNDNPKVVETSKSTEPEQSVNEDPQQSSEEEPTNQGKELELHILSKIKNSEEYKQRLSSLDEARENFARLSLKGGFKLALFKKSKENLSESKEAYDKAVKEMYQFVKTQIEESGFEVDINALAVYGAVEERFKIAQKQEEVLNESKYKKFINWYAQKGKLAKFAINAGIGAGAGLALGAAGATAAVAGVAVAGVRFSRGLLSANGRKSFDQRSSESGRNFAANILQFNDEVDSREISSSVMKQFKESQKDTRIAYGQALATVAAGAVLGNLLNDRLPNIFGSADAEAPTSGGEVAPQPDSGADSMFSPEDFGQEVEGGASAIESFVDHVNHGEGITHTLRDLAEARGLESLTGSELYDVYEQFESQLSQLSGTYDMGNGDFGIQSPGSWEVPADLAEDLEQAMREKIANR